MMSTPINSGSKNSSKDMPKEYRRVSICDCNNGRYITSISKLEIEFIYETLIRNSVKDSSWITNAIKENALNVVNAIHDYMTVSDER